MYIYYVALILFINLFILAGCAKKGEKELDETADSIDKAYDRTTEALKNTVEEINDAVYR